MGVGGEVVPATNKIFMEETNMKKIIATVLAMVMALALCTTAFAATKTDEIDKEGYTLMDMANKEVTITAAKFTKTVTDAQVVTSGSKTTTTYFADKYVIDNNPYYACDEAIATHKLVKGNTVVFLTTVDLSAGTEKVATAYVEAKDEPACGEIKDNSYTIDGVNYVAGGTNFAVLNGKFVTYGAKTTTAPHDFTKKNTTTDNKGKIVSITCDSCKKSFTVVEAGKVPTNYTGEVDNTTLAGMVILLGTTTATPAGSTTTTSPKTFDAGIAMYVGMALTSVAGSAVVIGKKKEF